MNKLILDIIFLVICVVVTIIGFIFYDTYVLFGASMGLLTASAINSIMEDIGDKDK